VGSNPTPSADLQEYRKLRPRQIASAVLEQLGQDQPRPFGSPAYRRAYAEHRIAGYPDVSGPCSGSRPERLIWH